VEGRLLWIYGHASSTRRKREVGRPVTHLDSVGRHAMQDGGCVVVTSKLMIIENSLQVKRLLICLKTSQQCT
jgi:hypothetical protein